MFSVRLVKDKLKKKKMKSHSRTSKIIIVFIILSLMTYTGLAMFVQIKSGIELSPTLTTCVFGFFTGELWMLATIKKTKINNGQKVRAYNADIENYKGESHIVVDSNGENFDGDEAPKG